MYILIIVLFLIVFYLVTNTSEKKIERKIERSLKYEEVFYKEEYVRYEEEEIKSYEKEVAIEECYLDSHYTNERMKYIVITPKKEGTYPCVFFLHGIRDAAEDWITKGRIIENYKQCLLNKKIKEMILVIPASGDKSESWYADYVGNEKRKYESYFIKELIPRLKSEYKPSSMGIAGFSMGGHGAFKIGLRNSELFEVMGSFAGAISLIRLSVNRRVMRLINLLYIPPFIFNGKDKKHFLNVFGSFGYQIVKQDPYTLIKYLNYKAPEKLNGKHFYLSVGDEDRAPYLMLQQWLDIVGRLKKYNINFKANLYKGETHTWEYVSKDLPNLLSYFSKHLK